MGSVTCSGCSSRIWRRILPSLHYTTYPLALHVVGVSVIVTHYTPATTAYCTYSLLLMCDMYCWSSAQILNISAPTLGMVRDLLLDVRAAPSTLRVPLHAMSGSVALLLDAAHGHTATPPALRMPLLYHTFLRAALARAHSGTYHTYKQRMLPTRTHACARCTRCRARRACAYAPPPLCTPALRCTPALLPRCAHALHLPLIPAYNATPRRTAHCTALPTRAALCHLRTDAHLTTPPHYRHTPPAPPPPPPAPTHIRCLLTHYYDQWYDDMTICGDSLMTT